MKKITNADLPESLFHKMEGFQPVDTFESNGCSCSPDEFGGVDLRPACHFHDWAYFLGGGTKERKKADQAFYRNLRACDLSRWKAKKYYRKVRFWGASHFYWHKSQKPKHFFFHRIYLFFERYINF